MEVIITSLLTILFSALWLISKIRNSGKALCTDRELFMEILWLVLAVSSMALALMFI